MFKDFPKAATVNPPTKKVQPPPVKTDWILRGVTHLESGWLVVLGNKKDPRQNVVVYEGKQNDKGVELVSVTQHPTDYTQTIAKIKSSGREHTIGYSTTDIASRFKASKSTGSKGSKAPSAKRPLSPHKSSNSKDGKSGRWGR